MKYDPKKFDPTNFTNEEFRQYMANLSLEIDKLKISQDKTDEQMKKTDEQMRKTDEQIKKTDERFNRISGEFEGVKKSNGQMSEDFFYTSLNNKKMLGGIQYDEVEQNWKYKSKKLNLQDQYDVIMINGKDLAIVEVKYKADSRNIKQLERKMKNFPLLYPEYKEYKIHGAIAGLTMSSQTEEKILESGYSVVRAQGDHIEVKNPLVLK